MVPSRVFAAAEVTSRQSYDSMPLGESAGPGTAWPGARRSGMIRCGHTAMKKRFSGIAATSAATIVLTASLIELPIQAQDLLESKSGESIKSFAQRVIPRDCKLAHDVVVGTFGPSSNNVVILFTVPYSPSEPGDNNYRGWVLIPDKEKAGMYRKELLPPMEEIPGLFEIQVKAVFFAQADKDKELELLVLYEYYRNGSGTDYGDAVYVYDWNGKSFVSLEEVGDQLVGLTSAAAVRRKLGALKK